MKQIYPMENEKNKNEVTPGNDHPKPTDDVQLEIETVTPSTEKETAQPGGQEKTGEAAGQQKPQATDQVEKETDKPSEESKTGDDDKRDDIETTTPSA